MLEGNPGHADPAVTLRVYSHVLREHALAQYPAPVARPRLPSRSGGLVLIAASRRRRVAAQGR